MAFESRRMQRLSKLFGAIEERKQTEEKSPTYKDAPALREIADITREELSANTSLDAPTTEDAIIIIRFLAESYDALARYSISAYYYVKLFELLSFAKSAFSLDFSETAHDFHNAIRVRNAYVDDDAPDLCAIAAPLLSEEIIKERLTFIKARRRAIRLDPVETTKEYLAVIDYVEERIALSRKTYGVGSSLEYFALKKKFLLELGIAWQSPADLNPRVNFEKYEA